MDRHEAGGFYENLHFKQTFPIYQMNAMRCTLKLIGQKLLWYQPIDLMFYLIKIAFLSKSLEIDSIEINWVFPIRWNLLSQLIWTVQVWIGVDSVPRKISHSLPLVVGTSIKR